MKILFLTLTDFNSLNERNIYTDLLRELIRHGHQIRVISPTERKSGHSTYVVREHHSVILKLRIGNIHKTSIIEKGISTVMMEPLYIRAIRKYFAKEKFDLVLYSTPPITFCKAVEYVKKRDHTKTYLLLKDIFPQNAVDMGMLRESGIKGLLYRYFRAKEKKLYQISDCIGCMSEANVAYLLKHNPAISRHKVEVCPNSIEPDDMSLSADERVQIRKKYNIPLDKTVFIYGGNLGRPQGIPFMLKCMHSQRKNENVFFLIIGDGTEYGRIEQYVEKYKPENMILHKLLPKADYDKMVAASDVGMIFLDHRFTIPNFPSRLLNYMAAKLPILACTDPNTDIGKVIVDNGFGWWCESDDVECFCKMIKQIIDDKRQAKMFQENSYNYLLKEYNVQKSYRTVMLRQSRE